MKRLVSPSAAAMAIDRRRAASSTRVPGLSSLALVEHRDRDLGLVLGEDRSLDECKIGADVGRIGHRIDGTQGCPRGHWLAVDIGQYALAELDDGVVLAQPGQCAT